jgi:serine/threonine protein kinase/nucleoside phosphorylase
MGIPPPPKAKPVRAADVVIVTALEDELDAVLACQPLGAGQGGWGQTRDRHGFLFYVREFLTENGEFLRVAAAWSGGMGESAAATRAATLIDELSPSVLAMCGICAGKRGDVSLGDVIVADRVYSYDHGKLVAGEGKDPEFFHDIETYNLQQRWLVAAADFARSFPEIWEGLRSRPPSKQAQKRWLLHALRTQAEEGAPAPGERPDRQVHCPGWKGILSELTEDGLLEKRQGKLKLMKAGLDWLANDRLEHPDGPPSDPAFRVHMGAIGSGKTVREDPELFTRLRRLVRKTMAVDMEAAAIGAVAEKFGCRSLIVKAVSDHADHAKDDAFRLFACKASAEFLLEFLRSYHAGSKRAWRDPRGGIMPAPRYPDGETRHLSVQLDGALERKRQLHKAGASTGQVDREIVALRRLLREGGRLRAGGPLGGDRFLLVESIGQGGFATVWKAFDRKTQETVAIKVLHPNLAGAEERRERFFRGARKMAELKHPAVVRVIEQHGEDEGYYYFVMEYVPGGNLRQAVLDKAISLDKIVSIILRVGEALALAHSRGVVHRDIKPANILINGQGQSLITDFDLVRALDTTGGTRTGMLGTAAYAAPECMERPQDADPRADVYSLGMTAVFGVYGEDLPFAKIWGNREQFFSQLQCPEPLKKVLFRATSVEPSARYADAAEFISAIRHAGTPRHTASRRSLPQEESDPVTEPLAGGSLEDEETEPKPERTEPLQPEAVTHPSAQTATGASRTGEPALEGTDPNDTVPPRAGRRSRKERVSRSQSAAEPIEPPPTQDTSGDERRFGALMKVSLGFFAIMLATGVVIFWPKLTKRPIDGVGIYVTVDTNPKVNVRVQHSDKCGSPEPVTELGVTPIKNAGGAHLQDTLILENKTQGIYAVEEELLRFGEPGETKIIKREFRLGNVKLRVTPRSAGQLKISKGGQELGVYVPGMKLELMEGTHKLELRGDQLKEPVEFEVTVKARDVTEEVVDVSAHLLNKLQVAPKRDANVDSHANSTGGTPGAENPVVATNGTGSTPSGELAKGETGSTSTATAGTDNPQPAAPPSAVAEVMFTSTWALIKVNDELVESGKVLTYPVGSMIRVEWMCPPKIEQEGSDIRRVKAGRNVFAISCRKSTR